MAKQIAALAATALLLSSRTSSLAPPDAPFVNSRRSCLRKIVSAAGAGALAAPPVASAATQLDVGDGQGLAVVTESSIGKAFRRQIVRGAQVADKLDEKWERVSDGLRDKSRCDPNTNRRLYDNGKRRDGTSIGNPGLGELCTPEPLKPLDTSLVRDMLSLAEKSALGVSPGVSATALATKIQETKGLVRPSFDRSLENASTEDEKSRGLSNFELYATLRSINAQLGGSKAATRAFQLAWGKELIQSYAPNANRDDFVTPFPEKVEEELSDVDYDKNSLLDALGKLTVFLGKMKSGGVIGYSELSIPYDDYGSVVTVALDDYSPIGAEILLSEQGLGEGPMQAVLRALLADAGIRGELSTFYIDPSTTRQEAYRPTQLLLSANSLSKI
ncbi:hypothetical protein THAOC_20635 [Thalassiosira oceanica]|uniref:Plant heme peroxidase family profile domain-containing protein n=1 Tax=Thalassiosira oceanica TaxID=159749 RepID=K0SL59_THAOC|nr:hypothetical protein THAOC_20635 [Thalassiosira oceanica]|eukprot:EJK59177.1 hypothetical protein THAOC_20635 [Thalassiosira oceanica]